MAKKKKNEEVVEEQVENQEAEDMVEESEAEEPVAEEMPAEEPESEEEEQEEEEEPKPEPTKKQQGKKAQAEAQGWFEEFGAMMVKKGHGNRNIILRAGRAAGLTPSEAIGRFRAAEGTLEERISSLFE